MVRYDRRNKRGPGYTLAVVVANLLEALPGLTPQITKAVIADHLGPIRGVVGSWGESFNYITPRAGTAACACAVPTSGRWRCSTSIIRRWSARGRHWWALPAAMR